VLWVIGTLVVLAVLGLLLLTVYNRLIRARNRVDNAWSQVDVQLRRRYDLIPNLVETVKGYASHERATFEEVTNARTRAQQAGNVEQQAEAENVLTAAIGLLFAVAEAYPELRASENFQQLQEELSDTEDKIAAARRYYNNVVRRFNTAQQTLPTSLLAGPLGFRPREFFELEDEGDRAPARVEL
jgi:LemA protein